MLTCIDCGRQVEGGYGVCISCYKDRLTPCTNCMVCNRLGKMVVRPKFRGRYAVDCTVCKNERFILDLSPGRKPNK